MTFSIVGEEPNSETKTSHIVQLAPLSLFNHPNTNTNTTSAPSAVAKKKKKIQPIPSTTQTTSTTISSVIASPSATDSTTAVTLLRSSGGHTPPNTPPLPPQQQYRRRRSARVLDHDPIIAPGFGTRKDIARLSAQLSYANPNKHTSYSNHHSTHKNVFFPPEAVLEMMNARGRGLRSTPEEEKESTSTSRDDHVIVNPWADFLKEEEGTQTNNNNNNNSRKRASATSDDSTTPTSITTNTTASSVENDPKKRSKTAVVSRELEKEGARRNTGGTLVQCGEFNCSVVGRTHSSSKSKKTTTPATGQGGDQPFPLWVPTVILPHNIHITRVFTSCTSVHAIAMDTSGMAYGWGRNEANQLGSSLPANVITPTRLSVPVDHSSSQETMKITSAAVGKSHTLLLTHDGAIYACGSNKVGQCGVVVTGKAGGSGGDTISSFRAATLPSGGTVMTQIACGEDFSAALDSHGFLYTTGSSEFGQLANGETGQYFVTANKLAYTNCATFTRRRIFVQAPASSLLNEYAYDSTAQSKHNKMDPLDDSSSMKIATMALGKHHGIAVEDTSGDQDVTHTDRARQPRVFTWGCGNYGCLGHGVQVDEYFPRLVSALGSNTALLVGNNASSAEDDNHNNGRAGSSSMIQVSAGAQCSLLQTSAGHVYYWGKHRSVGEATMRPQLIAELAHNGHVVTHCGAGAQTVVCATSTGDVVAWGQGPNGELGFADRKSSAKPAFVESIAGKNILDLSCGYGMTAFVVEDASNLPVVDAKEVQALEKQLASTSKKSKK